MQELSEPDAKRQAARGPALRAEIEHLSPGYFALVMATGIVSIGLDLGGIVVLSRVLLWLTAASFVVLWVLYIWRAVTHRSAMLHDFRDPETAFAYFTVVAGTDVLAVRLLQEGLGSIAVPLLFFGAVLWFVFGYLLPWQVFMTRDGRPILARTNGTWFVWAVASQSLAIGMAQVQPLFAEDAEWISILAVLSWTVGVAIYAGVALLVLLRIIHFGITPREFEPPFWVAMGAMAIAVVAVTFINDMQSTPMIDATRTLIGGTIVVFWSFCVWLIPLLIGAGVWRHVMHKIPLGYVAALWSIVFPIGMFAVASINLGRVESLPLVESIGNITLIIAVVVWAIVFLGMLRHIVGVLSRTIRGLRS